MTASAGSVSSNPSFVPPAKSDGGKKEEKKEKKQGPLRAYVSSTFNHPSSITSSSATSASVAAVAAIAINPMTQWRMPSTQALPNRAQLTSLHDAVSAGDLDQVRRLWETCKINTRDQEGATPLHIAVRGGHVEIVTFLLEQRANLKAEHAAASGPLAKMMPLHFAVMAGNLKMIDQLLEADKDGSAARTIHGEQGSLFHLAIAVQQFKVLKHLCEKHPGKVKDLLNREAVTKGHRDSRTPLMLAAYLGAIEAMEILQAHGTPLEAADSKKRTALHWAAKGNHKAAVDWLVYQGCNLGAQTEGKKKPIDLIRGRDTASNLLKIHLENLVDQQDKLSKEPELWSLDSPENLVFKGGGPKGLSFPGALGVLEKAGRLGVVRRVAGTSAGAIQAALFAVGYNAEELQKILSEQDFEPFLDGPIRLSDLRKIKFPTNLNELKKALISIQAIFSAQIAKGAPKILDTAAQIPGAKIVAGLFVAANAYALNYTGLCEGEVLRLWIEKLIFEKTGIHHCTFGQLKEQIRQGKPFKHLHIMSSNLKGLSIDQINSEEAVWDDVIISDAVRASTAIPLVFKPHPLHIMENGKRVSGERKFGIYVDGGLICNFPIQIFDKRKYLPLNVNPKEGEQSVTNRRTLGFSLKPPKSELDEKREFSGFDDLIKAIGLIYYYAEEVRPNPMKEIDRFRMITIQVPKGVDLLSFKMSEVLKRESILAGVREGVVRCKRLNVLAKTASSIRQTILGLDAQLQEAERAVAVAEIREKLGEVEALIKQFDQESFAGRILFYAWFGFAVFTSISTAGLGAYIGWVGTPGVAAVNNHIIVDKFKIIHSRLKEVCKKAQQINYQLDISRIKKWLIELDGRGSFIEEYEQARKMIEIN